MHQLAQEFSQGQVIRVYDSAQLYGVIGKYRFLQFSDDAIQGAIDLRDPKRIVLEYPRAIIHLMDGNNSSFENVFVIGHGVGTIAGHFPDKNFTVAEIDEKVVALSRTFFDYNRDNIVIGDGRQILEMEKAGTFDFIILDAFNNEGTPYHLTTLEFFEMTKEKLSSTGSIIMNLTGRPNNDKLINAIYTTLSETFEYTKAFTIPGEDGADVKNILVVGSNRHIEFQLRAMAGFIEIELESGYILMDRV